MGVLTFLTTSISISTSELSNPTLLVSLHYFDLQSKPSICFSFLDLKLRIRFWRSVFCVFGCLFVNLMLVMVLNRCNLCSFYECISDLYCTLTFTVCFCDLSVCEL
ncbi:hypothetical protein QVD17_04642 [Tagetes erecta]|uniref:Uncharacterized protein n=1 Tax=Tagetes erecta TaxID=13708 RepID=A0AAD8LGP2_TARER|nr:hypothetical protein QVD17_04642 [Tagetes erecta]